MASTEELRVFLAQYLGSPYHGRKNSSSVTPDDIDDLVVFAEYDEIEQDIIDYGTAHPDAPFCDFLNFIKPGIKGDLTEEELLEDD